MTDLSERELIELGERYGIDVGEAEAGDLRDRVAAAVAGLDAIDEIAPPSGHDAGGDRSWGPTDGGPHGAVATRCRLAPTDDGPLTGHAVGIKDIVAVAGVPMQCGSEVMAGFVPGVDAAAVDRLRAAGATITAKTSLDEFAGGPHGITGRGPPVTNPHDPDHVPGGSSSGSAAAVAAGEVDVALGSDTGGSIRIPASFCGVVGLKPTYGLVPLHGVVENTYTLDHLGPLGGTVGATARALSALAGPDERDPASLQAAGREAYQRGGYVAAVGDPPAAGDLTVGLLEEGTGEGVTDPVAERARATLDRLSEAGATVRRVSVPAFRYGRAIKDCLSFVEMAVHWRAGGAPFRRGGVVDEGMQAGLARRGAAASGELGAFYRSKLLAGAHLVERTDGRWYTRAQAAREVLREEVTDALAGVDALALPTMAAPPPRVADAFDPGFDYSRNTRLADVTRHPAITVPDGTVEGLPAGFQLLGTAFGEAALLGVAERATEFTAPVPAVEETD